MSFTNRPRGRYVPSAGQVITRKKAMKGSGFKNIDEYIGTFPKEVQVILEEVRQTIRRAAPEAVEAISYQDANI